MIKNIGLRIKSFRQKAGYSQGKLAELCGWDSQSRISNYEAGVREPSLVDIEIIAKALDKEFIDLLMDKVPDPYKTNAKTNIPIYAWENVRGLSESKPIGIISKISSSEAYALQVQDDSMCTTVMGKLCFNPGTIVIVEPTKEAVIDKYFIIRHIETGTVLFRQLKNLGTTKRFMPINPIADNCLLEEAEIIGVVVASMNLDL